jgi:hypothetical protein
MVVTTAEPLPLVSTRNEDFNNTDGDMELIEDDMGMFDNNETQLEDTGNITVLAAVDASGDASFGRNNASLPVTDDSSLFVQGGAAYAVVAFPIDFSQNLTEFADVDGDISAIFCMEHVPNDRNGTLIYSMCQLLVPSQLSGSDVESWNGDDEFFMPQDCVGGVLVDFEVAPDSATVCMDVSKIVFQSSGALGARQLQPEMMTDVLFMIDNIDSSATSDDDKGDQFYSREEAGSGPELSIVTASADEEDDVSETLPPTASETIADSEVSQSPTPGENSTDAPTLSSGGNETTTSPTSVPVVPITETQPPSGSASVGKLFFVIPLLVVSLWV